MGVMRIVELDHVAEARNGLGEVVKKPSRRICRVDDEHPFSAALANRVRNGETDLGARYRKYQETVKADEAKRREEWDREVRSIWGARRRIIVTPDAILPAGLAERARRARR